MNTEIRVGGSGIDVDESLGGDKRYWDIHKWHSVVREIASRVRCMLVETKVSATRVVLQLFQLDACNIPPQGFKPSNAAEASQYAGYVNSKQAFIKSLSMFE